MADRADDLSIGIKSSAILFGRYDRLCIGLFQCLFLLGIILLGILTHQSALYFIAWCLAILISLYQQVLIKDRHPPTCFRAFLTSQHIGWIMLAGLALSACFR